MRLFISGYNRIPNNLNTLRVGAKIFVSAKKCLRKKKFPDTCGHRLYLPQKKKELGDIYHDSIIIIIVIVDLADHSWLYW